MALSEGIINKIKVLIYENKKEDAEAVLKAEAGLSDEEASDYIARLNSSLPNAQAGNNKSKSNKAAAFLLLGLGLLMWGLAIFFYIKKEEQIANSYLTTGVVTGFIINDGAAPIINYEIDGKAYQYTSNIYSSPPSFELNETVEIYVNNDDANDIIINSFANKWLIVTILASFGLVFDLIGILLLKLKSSGQSSNVTFFDSQDDHMTPFDD